MIAKHYFALLDNTIEFLICCLIEGLMYYAAVAGLELTHIFLPNVEMCHEAQLLQTFLKLQLTLEIKSF